MNTMKIGQGDSNILPIYWVGYNKFIKYLPSCVRNKWKATDLASVPRISNTAICIAVDLACSTTVIKLFNENEMFVFILYHSITHSINHLYNTTFWKKIRLKIINHIQSNKSYQY